MQRKSNSKTSQRFMRNLLSSLVLYGRIVTTKQRSKWLKAEFQGIVNKLKGSKNVAERTKLANKVFYGGAIKKVVDEVDTFRAVRVYDYRVRKGDGSIQTIVEIEKDAKKPLPKDKK